MFIETRERRPNGLIRGWVNSTEIVRILDEGPDGVVAELRDGKTVQLDRHQHIPQAGHQVLPAQPGFELLTALLGGWGEYAVFSRQPIIGWRVNSLGTEPVVVDDWFEAEDNSHDCINAIRYPDGQVTMAFDTFDRAYPNETVWRELMQSRHKKLQKTTALEETESETPRRSDGRPLLMTE